MPSMQDGLRDKRILVVDAGNGFTDNLRQELLEHGANVLEPAPSANAAVSLIEARRVDAAIVDITINPEAAYFLAEALEEDGIPFVFVTLPAPNGVASRFSRYELEKPDSLDIIAQALFGRVDQ